MARAAIKGVDGYTGAVAFTGRHARGPELGARRDGRAGAARPVGRRRRPQLGGGRLAGREPLGVVRQAATSGSPSSASPRASAATTCATTSACSRSSAHERRLEDVLRLRPVTSHRPDSVGPILRTGGAEGLPRGERRPSAPARRRSSAATGRPAPQVPAPRRAVDVDGHRLRRRLSFPVKAGDRYEYSTFFVDAAPPSCAARCSPTAPRSVTFSRAPLRICASGGYVSAASTPR